MLATSVVKAGVISLTNIKRAALDHEYGGFQWWMQFGVDMDILSQYKRAKGWYYDKKEINYKDYPLVIPHNQMDFRRKETKLTKNWVKISVRKRKGIGIWLPIKTHKPLLDKKYLKDSLLVKNKKGNYELRLVYQYDVPQIKHKNVLAIDLGERNIATVCGSFALRPKFYGRNVRGIRRHYAYIRKSLGRKKLLKKIKTLADKEKRVVEQELHKIANNIVKTATATRSLIVIGKMKGINKKNRGKRLNRIIHNMPYLSANKDNRLQSQAERHSSKISERIQNLNDLH